MHLIEHKVKYEWKIFQYLNKPNLLLRLSGAFIHRKLDGCGATVATVALATCDRQEVMSCSTGNTGERELWVWTLGASECGPPNSRNNSLRVLRYKYFEYDWATSLELWPISSLLFRSAFEANFLELLLENDFFLGGEWDRLGVWTPVSWEGGGKVVLTFDGGKSMLEEGSGLAVRSSWRVEGAIMAVGTLFFVANPSRTEGRDVLSLAMNAATKHH